MAVETEVQGTPAPLGAVADREGGLKAALELLTDDEPEAGSAETDEAAGTQGAGTTVDGEGEPAAKEKAPDPAAAAATKTEKVAARFAALTRQEQAVRREREAMKAERAELDAYKKRVDDAKADPAKLLELAGVKYDELTQRMLNEGKPDASREVAELRTSLELERKERAERERTEADARSRGAIEQTVRSTKDGITQHARTNAAKYPLVATYSDREIADAVYAGMEQHFDQTKEILSYEKALDLLEKSEAQRAERYAKATGKGSPRTITTALATQRSKVGQELSFEERKAAVKRQLELDDD